MIQGKPCGIDLQKLISEENGDVSLSRFQFLVFTFVTAIGLLVITLNNKAFLDGIPNGSGVHTRNGVYLSIDGCISD